MVWRGRNGGYTEPRVVNVCEEISAGFARFCKMDNKDREAVTVVSICCATKRRQNVTHYGLSARGVRPPVSAVCGLKSNARSFTQETRFFACLHTDNEGALVAAQSWGGVVVL